jgi:hypothetical protein
MLLSRTKSEVTRTPPNGFACPASLADPILRVGDEGGERLAEIAN